MRSSSRKTPATDGTRVRSHPQDLCTVGFAAKRLQLHPKTVLRFIGSGRLPATKIGKAYRIVRRDLEAFAGTPIQTPTPADAAWVTAIVDVPEVGANLARKLAGAMQAALNSREARESPIRADVIYEPERSQLKVVIGASPGDASRLIGLVRIWLEQMTP